MALAGFAVALPYTWSISRGWDPRTSGLHQSLLQLDYRMFITIGASSAFALAFAWGPARRAFAERRAELAPLVAYAAALYVFSLFMALPNHNESKFAFEVFAPLAILGGVAFLPWCRAVTRRFGGVGRVALAVFFLVPPVVTIVGFTLDPTRWATPETNPLPGEMALYAWIQRETPRTAVVVDNGFRDLIMVRARRQLYLGSSAGPEKAGFPLTQVIERRAVMTDLYVTFATLDSDVAALVRLGRPGYVLVRDADFTPAASPRPVFAGRPDLFQSVYDRDGFVVYHVVPSAAAGAERSGPSQRP
jgi:hypothetical protein